jgi:hypothetical protein
MTNKSFIPIVKTAAILLISFVSPESKGDLLEASDVSVLWPLKASSEKDKVFLKSGDGFCNAPSLSEGSFLPREDFENFAALAFNSSQGVCRRDKSLEDQFFLAQDEELLKQDVHLALVKGIAPTACNYTSWKVTGMRFDPCRPSRLQADPNAGKCSNVIRIVAQPFEKQTNGLWAVRDFTIHLAYVINDLPAFMSDLKKTASIARQVEATEEWEPKWDSDPQILRPHHALRNELNSCDKPFSSAMRSLLKTWATRKNLFMLSWMTSSFGLKEWTFGEAQVSGEGQSFKPGQILGKQFINFSDSLLQEGKQSTTAALYPLSGASLAKQLSIAALPSLPESESSAASRTAHIDAIQRVLDPKKISQSQSDCVSCHLAPQILERIRSLYKTPNAIGSGEFKAVTWPGFLSDRRTFSQLRNFGYGPQFQLSVNRRTINETQDIFEILSQIKDK